MNAQEFYSTVALPCNLCGEQPEVRDGRIKHPSCLEKLLAQERNRFPTTDWIDEYLAKIDQVRTPNLPHEEAAALWPTVSILMWNALNNASLRIAPTEP